MLFSMRTFEHAANHVEIARKRYPQLFKYWRREQLAYREPRGQTDADVERGAYNNQQPLS